jgi:hypothetical protein
VLFVWNINNPVAGDAMRSRCALVMRGVSIPFVVLFTSSNADALGVVVPAPALPVAGKVLVCAFNFIHANANMITIVQISFFILFLI